MTREKEEKLIFEMEKIANGLERIACCLELQGIGVSSETIGKAAADYAKEYTMRTGKNPYDFS